MLAVQTNTPALALDAGASTTIDPAAPYIVCYGI
jgi:hypothetical protein